MSTATPIRYALAAALSVLGAMPAAAQLAPASAESVERDALLETRKALRFVTTAQEAHFAGHSTYTADVNALRRELRAAWDAPVQVRVLYASARGWSAVASHPSLHGRSCVIFVGSTTSLPSLPVTQARGLRPAEEGVPVCDEE